MKNFDELLSDEQLEKLASGDPTVSIQIPLRETQPIKQALAEKKNVIIGRIKKQRTQQLAALLTSGEGPTSPIIKTDQVSPSGLTIHDIYQNAGLGTEEDDGFNVFRVESMLDDTSIIELDDRAKEAAVVMALKTHDVKMESVIDDGRDHQMALEAHDLRFQDELNNINLQLETENTRLHAEIERYANPRIERMEANQKRLEELQETYESWQERKRSESERLDKMLNRWTDVRPKITPPPLAISETRPKRETAPLPYFEERTTTEAGFLEPVVLTSSELDSEVIRRANAFPDPGMSLDEPSAVFDLESGLASRSAGADMTMETKIKTSKAGNVGYYTWVILSFSLWILGGLTLATVVETMMPIAALGLAFGIPVGLALLMGMFANGHGRWLGYIAFLGYFGVFMTALGHLDPNNLAKLLSQDPVWLTEVSNLDGTIITLPEFLGSGLTKISNIYADFLYSIGLATKP